MQPLKIDWQHGTMKAARRTSSSRVELHPLQYDFTMDAIAFCRPQIIGDLPSGGGADNMSGILNVTFIMAGLGIYDNRKHIWLRTEIGTIAGRGGSRRPSFPSFPISFICSVFPFSNNQRLSSAFVAFWKWTSKFLSPKSSIPLCIRTAA